MSAIAGSLRSSFVIASLAVFLSMVAPAMAEDDAPAPGAIAYPPIGVVAERVRDQGTVTLSYRYHRQSQDGLMVGTEALTRQEVEDDYRGIYDVVPTQLDTNTHFIEVMWAPSEELMLMLSLPFLDKTMEQEWVGNGSFTTTSAGFGDLGIGALYEVHEGAKSRVSLNFALTVPTGSINQTDTTPMDPDMLVRLPYAMQLGSGTVDLRPGATYQGYWGRTNWGGQIVGVLRSGTNDEGYKLGNQYHVTGWLGRAWVPWLNTTFRLQWQQWFTPEGRDDLIEPTAVPPLLPFRNPANDPTIQGGQRLDAMFGLDILISKGSLAGTRLAVEAGFPAYQNLDGPQLGTSWLLTAGAQYNF
jgi:hypothetical protein